MRQLYRPCARAIVAVTILAGLAGCGGDDTTDDSSGGSSVACSDPITDESCNGAPCGGDIVGTWKLVTFCAPSCVSSVYDTVTFGADGSYNNGQGTWEYVNADTFAITVSGATAQHAYCVEGNRIWTQHGTNCGPGMSGPVSIVRRRDCGGSGAGGR